MPGLQVTKRLTKAQLAVSCRQEEGESFYKYMILYCSARYSTSMLVDAQLSTGQHGCVEAYRSVSLTIFLLWNRQWHIFRIGRETHFFVKATVSSELVAASPLRGSCKKLPSRSVDNRGTVLYCTVLDAAP